MVTIETPATSPDCSRTVTVRPRDGLGADTRQRIERAVIDAFSRDEFHRVNLIDIARSASVSLQTLYKYYGNKETLLFATLDRCLQQLEARLVDHLHGIADCKERLRKVFWIILDFTEAQPDVIQMMMSSVYLATWHQQDSFRNPLLFDPFLKVLREGRECGVLNDAVDEKILLDFILGVVFRLAQMYVHRGRKQSLTAQSDALFEMLWRAIANPAPNPALPNPS